MRHLMIVTALLLIALGAGAVASPSTPAAAEDCPICDVDLMSYSGPLTEDEVRGLLRALNMEYLSWATYGQVLQDFGAVRPFSFIQRAETTHITRLLILFQDYGVPIPENPWSGATPRYGSVAEACAAAADTESVDAAVYDELTAGTEREDIQLAYGALQWANMQHMRAFLRCAR